MFADAEDTEIISLSIDCSHPNPMPAFERFADRVFGDSDTFDTDPQDQTSNSEIT